MSSYTLLFKSKYYYFFSKDSDILDSDFLTLIAPNTEFEATIPIKKFKLENLKKFSKNAQQQKNLDSLIEKYTETLRYFKIGKRKYVYTKRNNKFEEVDNLTKNSNTKTDEILTDKIFQNPLNVSNGATFFEQYLFYYQISDIKKFLDDVYSNIYRNKLSLKYFLKNYFVTQKKMFYFVLRTVFNCLISFENFYILCIVVIWSFTEYFTYSVIISIFSFYSNTQDIISEIRKEYTHRKNEYNTLNKLELLDILDKNDGIYKVHPVLLLPGQIVELKIVERLIFDCELLKGSCTVDEANLTGESIPIVKYRGDILSAGIRIVSIDNNDDRFHCAAKVLKPEVPQALPQNLKPQNFHTKKETEKSFKTKILTSTLNSLLNNLKLLFCILLAASVLSCLVVWGYLSFKNFGVWKGLMLSFDLITILVSPAFFASVKTNLTNTESNLNSKDIRINYNQDTDNNIVKKINKMYKPSEVKMIVFDKTGTLTKNSVEMLFPVVSNENSENERIGYIKQPVLLIATAVANTIILDDKTNKIMGDPLDVSMIEHLKTFFEVQFLDPKLFNISSKHKLVKITDKGFIIVLSYKERFQFQASTKRMSVIVKVEQVNILKDNKIYIEIESLENKTFEFFKGSPESISNMFKSEQKRLEHMEKVTELSAKGLRVLSMSYNILPEKEVYTISRKSEPLCALPFKNPLKPMTKPTIDLLRKRGYNISICTGDSLLTTVSIGKELGIAEEVLVPYLSTDYDNTNNKFNEIKSLIESDDEFQFCESKNILSLRWATNLKTENYKNYKTSELIEKILSLPIAVESKVFNTIRRVDINLYGILLKKGVLFTRMGIEDKRKYVEGIKMHSSDNQTAYETDKVNLFESIFPNLDSQKFFNIETNFSLEFDKNILRGFYSDKNKIVMYCGDGANDISAMEESDVSVGLGLGLEADFSINDFCKPEKRFLGTKEKNKLEKSLHPLTKLLSVSNSSFYSLKLSLAFLLDTALIQWSTLTLLMFSKMFMSEYMTMFQDLGIIFLGGYMNSLVDGVDINNYNVKDVKNKTNTRNKIIYSPYPAFIQSLCLFISNSVFYMIVVFVSGFKYFGVFNDVIIDKNTTDLMFQSKKTSSIFHLTNFQLLFCVYNCFRPGIYRQKMIKNKVVFPYFVTVVLLCVFLLFSGLEISKAFGENFLSPKLNEIFEIELMNNIESAVLVSLILMNWIINWVVLKNARKRLRGWLGADI